jgi:uncharacterized membrane protein (UPF0127 family)
MSVQQGIERVKTAFCAFNLERQSFISLGVVVANTTLARLRGLIGRARLRSDEALWVVPSRGIHTFGLMFPIDVIYLDGELRVIDIVQNLGPLRVAPIRWNCASVLQLPAGSVSGSGTEIGDQLLICPPDEMERYWAGRLQEAGREDKPCSRKESGSAAHPEGLKRAI